MPILTLDGPERFSSAEERRIAATSNRKARLTAWGAYFGFPKCCVKQFVAEFDKTVVGDETPDRRPINRGELTTAERTFYPWCGSGFIPCSKCAPVARADWPRFIAERIVPNRKHHQPFPQDGF